MTWTKGPVPNGPDQRLELARKVCERSRTRFQAIATGIYGSVARGDDGPYSDIEALVVVPGARDETFEWVHGGWKIEVDVMGREDVMRDALAVPDDWAVTHANFVDVMPVYDPDGFFAELAQRIRQLPQAAFDQAIARLFVEELYEVIGKLRNARARDEAPPPGFVYDVVKIGTWLTGLANRRTYATATRAMADSLLMPEQLPGYEPLCRLAMAGDVNDPERVFAACEAFWEGAAAWAQARGLVIESARHLV